MLLLLNAKLVTIDVVLKKPRRKKSCPGYNGPGRWMTKSKSSEDLRRKGGRGVRGKVCET